MGKSLSDQRTMERFKEWIKQNSASMKLTEELDIESEFGKDLSYNEAIELALQKFPTLWKPEFVQSFESKPKQIVFVKGLVGKIMAGKVQVTYRKSPKVGTYYVIENRFQQKSESAKILIEFYRTDRVSAYDLSDEEAQLAGIQNAEEIRSLFEKWYGTPIPTLYRNWFRLKEN